MRVPVNSFVTSCPRPEAPLIRHVTNNLEARSLSQIHRADDVAIRPSRRGTHEDQIALPTGHELSQARTKSQAPEAEMSI